LLNRIVNGVLLESATNTERSLAGCSPALGCGKLFTVLLEWS